MPPRLPSENHLPILPAREPSRSSVPPSRTTARPLRSQLFPWRTWTASPCLPVALRRRSSAASVTVPVLDSWKNCSTCNALYRRGRSGHETLGHDGPTPTLDFATPSSTAALFAASPTVASWSSTRPLTPASASSLSIRRTGTSASSWTAGSRRSTSMRRPRFTSPRVGRSPPSRWTVPAPFLFQGWTLPTHSTL